MNIDKNTLYIFLGLFIVTIILFAFFYHPNHVSQIVPYTKISFRTLEHPQQTVNTTWSVTLLVNSTQQIDLHVIMTNNTIYYYNGSITYTVDGNGEIFVSGTKTWLYSIDQSILVIGPLKPLCGVQSPLSGTDTFWPEAFLSHYGYTTATLIGVDYCNNEYIITAS